MIREPVPASAQVSVPKLTDELTSDFRYIVNNTMMDTEDVAIAPLHIASPNSPVFSPKFTWCWPARAPSGAAPMLWTRPCGANCAA